MRRISRTIAAALILVLMGAAITHCQTKVEGDASGVRRIVGGTVGPTGEITLRPLGMNNESLGGWSWRWVRSSDGKWEYKWTLRPLMNGLLVRVWGKITQIDPLRKWFCIDDGSNLKNYAQTRTGVRVFITDPGSLAVGDYVAVTGVCGALADETTGDPVPVVHMRSISDIQKY